MSWQPPACPHCGHGQLTARATPRPVTGRVVGMYAHSTGAIEYAVTLDEHPLDVAATITCEGCGRTWESMLWDET